jgi:hypothetical protein
MDSMVKLLDVAPEVEVANGLVYILLDGKRAFAYPPHIARVANDRIRRALDAMDAANSEKVVAFR